MTATQRHTSTGPSAELVRITPTMAKEWLAERNTRNRNLRSATVAAYARDMTAGRWQNTAEPIKLSASGVLLDGQHRLAAIARSGVTVTCFVATGLDESAQDVMDSGLKRQAGDALAMDGMKNATRVAAAARVAMCRATGQQISKSQQTNAQVQEFVRANPELVDAVEMLGRRGRAIPLNPRVADYCYWWLSCVDAHAAEEFFEALTTGANLGEDSPVLALRRRLTGNYGAMRRISLEEQVAAVVRAWNAWRRGQSMQRIQTTGRAGVVTIPEPV